MYVSLQTVSTYTCLELTGRTITEQLNSTGPLSEVDWPFVLPWPGFLSLDRASSRCSQVAMTQRLNKTSVAEIK